MRGSQGSSKATQTRQKRRRERRAPSAADRLAAGAAGGGPGGASGGAGGGGGAPEPRHRGLRHTRPAVLEAEAFLWVKRAVGEAKAKRVRHPVFWWWWWWGGGANGQRKRKRERERESQNQEKTSRYGLAKQKKKQAPRSLLKNRMQSGSGREITAQDFHFHTEFHEHASRLKESRAVYSNQ